ncbi:uncharacterized protein I303_103307 [Kwoniella dejecticola CBS 10117]|uniref:Short-chain dehydrogenase/reductase SDR n=1 Tax=Kwoniella dejecticola CBS 10117 TaxID=1296121 RepID=A0A1A6A6D4_9TREE|nr:uncharacterized protein I303_03330 [Kwoniella dejecticola CBS 10117]OBR85619.1 hypothetical protein I303_03330 [Kwoniella dejecticola CBS 10117]
MSDLNRFRIENLFTVAGQTVLITGGGSGIGRSLTSAFIANGAKVIIGDVSTKEGAEAVFKQVSEKVDSLDTVINCAGISILFNTPSHEVSDPEKVHDTLASVENEDWVKTHQVNVNGPYYVSVAAIPLLRKSSNPNIIMISSVAGLVPQRGNNTFTYGVSKAGVIHLSSMLAGRLHPLKIRVNCLCPGIFPSEMTSTKDENGNIILGDMGTKAVKRSTMGRPGLPEEIAAPILLLASKGGMYMNDTCINVDGGRYLVMKGIYDGYRLPDDSYID